MWNGLETNERQASLWHNRLAHVILYGADARGREHLAEAKTKLADLLDQRVPGNQRHRVARWWESERTKLRRMWNDAEEVSAGTRAPKLAREKARDRSSQSRSPFARGDADRAADFIRDVSNKLHVGDRQVRMHHDRGTVFIRYINLPSGVGGAGGGAEAENNRLSLVVRGFDKDGKVKVETLVSNLYKDNRIARENRVSVRARTGTEAAIARYIADSLNRIAQEVPPNFTHTGRDRDRARRRRRH